MVKKSFFEAASDDLKVSLITIANSSGMEVNIMNYGAIIQSLKVPDKHGVFDNIVLGYDTLGEYKTDSFYLGAVVGRYANRIARGTFSIDGKAFTVNQNDRGNHLHGGLTGFNKVIWSVLEVQDDVVRLEYVSPDGEEGYPGNLRTEVTYTLTADNRLQVDYKATTDRPTIVNLVQHSYFNLAGAHKNNILDHELKINANAFLPVNESMIPTGELRPVQNTPFDFRSSITVGSRIQQPDKQLQYGVGYDHCWVLNPGAERLALAASLYEPESGRLLETFTTMPGLHVYSGNFLKDKFQIHQGICLETQHFPDAPNQPRFPSTVLRPGERYEHSTVFKFTVR